MVPFDFTDRSGTKWRPAVVVSGERYHRETPDVLTALDLAALDRGLRMALDLP